MTAFTADQTTADAGAIGKLDSQSGTVGTVDRRRFRQKRKYIRNRLRFARLRISDITYFPFDLISLNYMIGNQIIYDTKRFRNIDICF